MTIEATEVERDWWWGAFFMAAGVGLLIFSLQSALYIFIALVGYYVFGESP